MEQDEAVSRSAEWQKVSSREPCWPYFKIIVPAMNSPLEKRRRRKKGALRSNMASTRKSQKRGGRERRHAQKQNYVGREHHAGQCSYSVLGSYGLGIPEISIDEDNLGF